ncbi:MAG TPA: alpha/beta fold hydrolase [Anaeromyxobacter sp.]
MDVEPLGSGRDLVLLHSLLTDRSAFDAVAPALARERRVWRVNLPGYGRSAPGGTTIEDLADRVAAALEALRLPGDTDVLGNGLGGFVAAALAVRHGHRLDRLVLVDCLASFPEAGKEPLRALARTVRAQGMGAALDTAVRRMFPQGYIEAHPDVVGERKEALRRMDPGTFSTLCLALTQVDLAPELGRIQNRALVLAGELDQTTPPQLVRRLADGIAGARFALVPGCGHCPQIEKPEAFLAAVGAFLPAAKAG